MWRVTKEFGEEGGRIAGWMNWPLCFRKDPKSEQFVHPYFCYSMVSDSWWGAG